MSSVFKFGVSALIFLIITVILSLIILLINFILNKSVKVFPWLWREKPDRAKVKNEPIEKQIYKCSGIKPDKVIVCGQNLFAFNSNKKKIFIQTYMDSDGILLDYKDIVSFEVPECDEGPEQSGTLSLKIATHKKGYEEIIMPFITAPSDMPGFADDSANEAVKEVTAVLRTI